MTTTPTLWRAAQQANQTDSAPGGDDQSGVRLIGLTNGNFLAVWEDNSDVTDGKNGDDIIGRIYDPLGNRTGSEFRVNTFFGDDEGNFTAAALPNGNFVVVYEDTNDNGTSIRFVVREADGTFVGSGTIVADSNNLARGQPSVTVAADGSFVVAYQQDLAGNTTSPAEIILVKVSSALTVGPKQGIMGSDASGSDADIRTDVAALTNGTLAVVSTHLDEVGGPINPDPGADDFMILLTVTGSPAGTVSVADTGNNTSDDVAPVVAALAGGGFVVAWQNDDANDTDARFQIYTAAGAEVGGVRSVNNTGGNDDKEAPDAIGLPDGGFVIVYENGLGISLQRYSATGAEVGAEVSVATSTTSFVGDPTVTLTDDGRMLVGWRESTFSGGIGGPVDNDVRFAIFDPRDNVINGDDTNNTITSRIGGTTVNGNGGKDTLFGQGAADTLVGGNDSDTLFGGGGNDILIGGAAIDTIKGESGSDTIRILNDERGDIIDGGTDLGGGDVDRLDLGALTTRKAIVDLAGSTYTIRNADGSAFLGGNVFALRNMEAVSGTQLDDIITGNTRLNVLNGNDGDDTISGGLSVDTLNGGDGDDTLLGGSSTDRVNGGAGDDTIRVLENEAGDHTNGGLPKRGEPANDIDTLDLSRITSRFAIVDLGVEYTIRNADSSVFGVVNTLINIDNVLGTRLGDVINGTRGVNVLSGNEGGDTIFGDDGKGGVDTLNGGKRNDILVGGGGTDRANGDAGDDTILVFDSEFGDNTNGGADTDLLDLGNIALRHASIDLRNETYTIRNANDSLFGVACALVDVENVAGTQLGDLIIGDTGHNVLDGNGGADTLDGGGRSDTMRGGAGNDTYVVDHRGDVVDESTGTGTRDKVVSSVDLSLADIAHVKGNVERLTLTGSSAIDGTGNALANTLIGNGAANTLDGGDGGDTMRGGGGADIYIVDSAVDIVDESAAGSDGVDRVDTSVSFSLADTAHAKGAIENLTLTGAAAINASGNGGDNTLVGNGAANVLNGRGGADTMAGGGDNDTYLVDDVEDIADETGGTGSDTVRAAITFSLANAAHVKGAIENLKLTGSADLNGTGNAAANSIAGNSGNNTINGKGGIDTLDGAGGNDRFLFATTLSASTNFDHVTSFVRGADRIVLDDGIFNQVGASVTAAEVRVVGDDPPTAATRLIYNPSNGRLSYDFDGGSAGNSILFAILENRPGTLTASDFDVVA